MNYCPEKIMNGVMRFDGDPKFCLHVSFRNHKCTSNLLFVQ